MSNNSYRDFSKIYDLLMTDVDYDLWASFIAGRLGNRGGHILEAACGTGSMTCRLYDKGFKVTAFDLSSDMLMIAKQKLGRSPGVRLLCLDMETFAISGEFDLVLCCCDGVNYLSDDALRSFITRAFSHLDEGGKLIFDMSTEHKYRTVYNDTYVYDDGSIFYVWENEFAQEQMAVNTEINFFMNGPDGRYSRVTEQQTQHVHKTQDVLSYLEAAGFENIEQHDDYTDNLGSDSDMRAVFICEKGIRS